MSGCKFKLVAISVIVFWGCASARMSDRQADDYFRNHDFDKAAVALKDGLLKQGLSGRDRLLYLLDLALVLRYAGRFEESNKYFFQAEKLSEISDYTSLGAEAATLLTSDNIKDFKTEDFEHLMINVYLSMNFAEMGKLDDALVEARRVNRKLYLMTTEGKRNYKQNNFARYLSGVYYEAEGEWSDAFIDYKKAYKNDPSLKLTLQPVKGSEVIVLYENGISPIKVPHESFSQIPKFIPRQNPYMFAEVAIDNVRRGATASLYSIESTAIENLDEKYAGLIAKKIAGIGAKEVVSDQIGKATDSPVLGFLTKILFYASDQADLRSWHLLPRDLQIGRYTVPPGEHVVQIFLNGEKASESKKVKLEIGQKVFVAFRSIP